MLCPLPLDNRVPILLILQRIYSHSPTCSTVIIVENFKDRLNLMEFLTTQEDEDNNKEFKRLFDEKNIRIITRDFLRSGRWIGHGLLGIIFNHLKEIIFDYKSGYYIEKLFKCALNRDKEKCILFI